MTTAPPSVNTSTYRERMSSVSDKQQIADLIDPHESVLDIGCADGSLISRLNLHDTAQYYGVENNAEMRDEALLAHPEYVVSDHFPENRVFDVIVLSSVLHEVYSYAEPRFNKDVVIDYLRELKPYLAENGRLIIRDGIIPQAEDFLFDGRPMFDDDETMLRLSVIDPDEIQDALFVIKDAGQCQRVTFFDPPAMNDPCIFGPRDEMLTFLNIVTWGWASMPREKYERVNFATEGEWLTLLANAGFTVTSSHTYCQHDYIDHLTRFVYLDEEIEWPTKILLVARNES